ncbi:FHA domain-containing protein [Streptomyces sp. SID3343]|uniref:FHA domain-containing protein n=1 Tax=Streptomyces sp. SID3343 TaxID=2690260 RepID=UPI0013689804|nr:FHA domain-containing protein [Streptomyces sp. SID3343]MYV97740.1 FHA domain-containing protein [Streptomyces sp. SID3343]MYW06488.1 FHA domain-containing protein [Streptomyces sp. SID3343]
MDRVCGEGHRSRSGDHCDECGRPTRPVAVASTTCPTCGRPVHPAAGFCEACWVHQAPTVDSTGDVGLLVAAAGAGALLKPFLDALAASLGGRLGESAAAALSRISVRRRGRDGADLVLDLDPVPSPGHDRATLVELPPDTPAEARRALLALDLTSDAMRGRRLRWDPSARGWSTVDEAGGHSPGWFATVAADRGYYNATVARSAPGVVDAFDFPTRPRPRRIELTAARITIGRSSPTRGGTYDIDLASDPGDPGVSFRHAALLGEPGTWTLVDLGSTNGTRLNDNAAPIPINAPITLHHGDRIHVGVWTTITLTHGR